MENLTLSKTEKFKVKDISLAAWGRKEISFTLNFSVLLSVKFSILKFYSF